MEVLNTANRHGLSVITFTDHDALPNKETVNLLKNNKEHPTKWVMGIELSSGLPLEIGGGSFSGLHIVGLFVDPTDQKLQEHCRKAQEARVARMEQMVANLRGLGFKISANDCLKASGGEAVGRPHIVTALKDKEENLVIIEQLRQKMQQAAEKDPAIEVTYESMMQQGEHQYPYQLFLTNNSFIPNVYVNYQYWVDLDKSVELIRNAGGLAVIAHYSTAKSKIPTAMLTRLLEQNRLDGAEVVFGLHAYDTEQEKDTEKDRQLCRDLCQKYNKITSGGVDIHTKEDFVDFVAADWYAKETIGMAERIIDQTGVNTKWSSLN